MLKLRTLHTDIDSLRLSGFELGLRNNDIGLGGNSSVITVLRKLESFTVSGNRVIQSFFLRVKGTQLEIIHRQFCLHGQTHGLKIGKRSLGCGRPCFHLTPHLSPHIGFPGCVKRYFVLIFRTGTISRSARTGEGSNGPQGGKIISSCQLHLRQRLTILRFRDSDRLIGNINLLDQRIEYGIIEYFPPLRFAPALEFLEIRRNRNGGPCVIRTNRAAYQDH